MVILILLPGLDGTGELYKALCPLLCAQFSIHVVPLPIMRDIHRNIRNACSYEEIAEAVEADIEKIVGSNPFHLLVESFSGALVPRLLQRNHLNIQRIVMFAGFLITPKAALVSVARYLPIGKLVRLPMINSLIGRLCLGRKSNGIQVHELLAVLATVPEAVFLQRLNAIKNMQRPAQSYEQKLLYIEGEQDILVNNQWKEILTVFPNAEFKKIKGPHFLCQSRAKPCADLAMNFVST